MKFNLKRWTRKTHYWGALICAVPIIIVLVSGVILMFKKDIAWIQPESQRGTSKVPSLSFEKILTIAQTVPEAEIKSWTDISRLDVRPSKGIVKIRSKNGWEVQVDNQTTEVLQVAYRRSDFFEALHDGSFFHESAKLWLFLPAGLILLFLWCSGMYLFLIPILAKRRSKKAKLAKAQEAGKQVLV
ncbi:MAG: PepSY domain-containing protein [Lentisphaeraceae bacterium]|nr:PepSY domain-containing protein [Lentisphaeraceae bacterium]